MVQVRVNTDVLIDLALKYLGFIISFFGLRLSLTRSIQIQVGYHLLRKFILYINDFLNKKVYRYFNKDDRWGSLEEILETEERVLCVLTGGSHGLGQQLYKKLASKYSLKYKNFELLIIDKDVVSQDNTFSNVHFLQHDFINRIGDKLDHIKSQNFKYKIVINNCGTRFEFHDFLQSWQTPSKFLDLLHINVLSACDLLSIIQPDYIITISSILSMISPKNGFLYSSTKNMISNMHESYVQIENKRGVLVLPGQLEGTDLFKKFEPMFKDNFKQVLSPLVSVSSLSDEIVEAMGKLENKVIVRPYYGFFMKILLFMPYWLQKVLRMISSVDVVED